jgi:hypothetical protein
MALLHDYLSAVRLYLPREVDQQDLITELSEHLQIKLDERAADLGRALTLEEETAVLWGYGHPVAVAARYGRSNAGLSFGRQLIGPEVFVLYRRILMVQFSMTLVIVTLVSIFGNPTNSLIWRYLGPMILQFVLTTTIFMAIDLFKSRWPSETTWSFPPPHLQAIPRWQSVSGFVVLSLFAIWWAAIPYAPFLLLGPAAPYVRFTDSWHAAYWPLLLPLLIGAAQRLATFVEPRWVVLQTITRLLTNSWSVFVAVQFLLAYPYVTANTAAAASAALGINNALWWNAFATFGLYWLVNSGFMVYLSARHASSYVRRRREQTFSQAQS